MQDNRIAAGGAPTCAPDAVPDSPRVRGVGVCDALRLELEPCQIAGAIEELEQRRGPLIENLEEVRNRWDALAEIDRQAGSTSVEEELWDSAYELEVLSALRAQLPPPSHDVKVTLLGRAAIVSTIVAATAQNAAEALAESVRESPRNDGASQARLRGAAAAAVAWVETFIECEALEWFDYDANCDPALRTPRLER